MQTGKYLKVPGKWLNSCGLGEKDRIFPVLDVTAYRNGTIHMVTVNRDGWSWVVHKEWRNAEFVDSPEVSDNAN